MANANFASGLKPVRNADGTPYNCSTTRYSCPSTYATALFIGDPVVKTGTSDADGYSEVNLATAGAGNSITGVVVGFEDSASMLLGYGAASTTRAVLVADKTNLLFEIQEDAVGGTVALASVGLNIDLIAAAGSTTNRVSGWMADSSTAASGATLQLNIKGFAHRPDNTPASANSVLLVTINKHTETSAQAGI
jgi:hypothetical protein